MSEQIHFCFNFFVVILFIGILDPVSELQYSLTDNNTVNISWHAPFSLNVPDFDIDITYCVLILNSTTSHLIYSKCGIIETHHSCKSFPTLLACGNYFIHVIAENPAGNSSATQRLAWNGGMSFLFIF